MGGRGGSRDGDGGCTGGGGGVVVAGGERRLSRDYFLLVAVGCLVEVVFLKSSLCIQV